MGDYLNWYDLSHERVFIPNNEIKKEFATAVSVSEWEVHKVEKRIQRVSEKKDNLSGYK